MDLIEKKEFVERHPWEIARASAVIGLVPAVRGEAICDIGAGDMYVSRRLAAERSCTVTAVDEGYAKASVENGIQTFRNIAELPRSGFTGVLAMDVLEHIADDAAFVKRAAAVVKPGGWCIVTVPAHQFLFSEHDRVLRHHRRYSRQSLRAVFAGTGLRVDACFYFFSSLFFLRLIQNLFPRSGATGTDLGGWRFGATSMVTRLITFLLMADFTVLRALSFCSINFPGLSLCAVTRKDR